MRSSMHVYTKTEYVLWKKCQLKTVKLQMKFLIIICPLHQHFTYKSTCPGIWSHGHPKSALQWYIATCLGRHKNICKHACISLHTNIQTFHGPCNMHEPRYACLHWICIQLIQQLIRGDITVPTLIFPYTEWRASSECPFYRGRWN